MLKAIRNIISTVPAEVDRKYAFKIMRWPSLEDTRLQVN
jgi:hypothetical protein